MSESEWKGEKRREKKKGIEGGRGGWGGKRKRRERERLFLFAQGFMMD